MYCYKCGLKICEKALECEHCGAFTAHVMRPRYYKTSIFFGAFLLTAPYLGFIFNLISPFVPFYLIIFGIIGLPLALASGRKAAIGLNVTAIILWILLIITPYFTARAERAAEQSGVDFSDSIYADYAEKNRSRVAGD
jgi:hypothetical protein